MYHVLQQNMQCPVKARGIKLIVIVLHMFGKLQKQWVTKKYSKAQIYVHGFGVGLKFGSSCQVQLDHVLKTQLMLGSGLSFGAMRKSEQMSPAMHTCYAVDKVMLWAKY